MIQIVVERFIGPFVVTNGSAACCVRTAHAIEESCRSASRHFHGCAPHSNILSGVERQVCLVVATDSNTLVSSGTTHGPGGTGGPRYRDLVWRPPSASHFTYIERSVRCVSTNSRAVLRVLATDTIESGTESGRSNINWCSPNTRRFYSEHRKVIPVFAYGSAVRRI